MAVGASGPAILRLVLKQAVWMAGLGAVIGLWLTLLFARALARLPFAVRPGEPIMLGAAALVVVLVVLAASYAPARRASRVSPLTALRYD
jgi:ABC-type antimicrobial peptide transport system permease subunit